MSFITYSEKRYQVVKDAQEVKTKINFSTIDCEDVSLNCAEGSDFCSINRIYEISVNLEGKTILGDVWFHADHDEKKIFQFGITIYEAINFSVDLNLKFQMIGKEAIQVKKFDQISNSKGKARDTTKTSVHKKISPDASYSNFEYTGFFNTKIDSDSKFLITGDITLKFDLSTTIVSKENQNVIDFKSLICENALESFKNKKNFTIICQGNEFHFNKTLLSMISEVFEKMIQDSDSKEARKNSVEIDDFNPKTIQHFQIVAFESENAKNEDLTADLLLFAQKYLIMPLVEKCKKYLINSLTNENIFEIIKVAYLIDDDDMLKTASDFFSKNKDQLQKTKKFKDFEKSNPMCMLKVLKYICGIEN